MTAAVLRAGDMVGLYQVQQQCAEVILVYPAEYRQSKYARSKLRRGHLTAGCKGAHGLVIQQGKWQPVGLGRLYEALLDIQLHQCDALYQIPGYHFWQHRPCLGMLLPHHEPHFRRVATPSGAPHALQEARHGERRIYLECSLEPAYIYAKLEGSCGAYAHEGVIVLHFLLCALPV